MPLYAVSPERVNQQRPQYDAESPIASLRGESRQSRDSSVHDKIAAINSLAYQSKQLERKTNDAALKRAMLGREEAESEMRRYKDDVRALRRQVEEGKDRERKVGERLEHVMVCNASGAKLTAANIVTGELWSSQRNTRAYTNTMGKGDQKSAQGVIQITVRCGKATRGAQIGPQRCKGSASRSGARERTQCKARTRSFRCKVSVSWGSRGVGSDTRAGQDA